MRFFHLNKIESYSHIDISCSLIHLRPTEFTRPTAFSRASLVKNYESFSVVRHQIEGEIPVKSAITSTLLTDLMDELGIKSPRRYISDDVSSWYFEVNFPQTYCVAEVLSMEEYDENHHWQCSEDGCRLTKCKVKKCDEIEVTVLRKDLAGPDLASNCGNALRLSIPKTDGKFLEFDYYGISEISVIGTIYEDPTPTCDHMSKFSSYENHFCNCKIMLIPSIWFQIKV